jgi:SAM-dependent methyltransferase
MSPPTLFAVPLEVRDLRACDFYHTIDLPDVGLVRGEWDLRGNIDRYLGYANFRGKRVLDVGSASGFLTFHIERQGAEVVSYDLSEDFLWDFVPFAGIDLRESAREFRGKIKRLNHGYWYCHHQLGSNARKVYGTVYNVPEAIGPVDVSVFGSILLHLRDPFLALQNALQLTRETVVVTEMLPRRNFYQVVLGWLGRPRMTFLPEHQTHRHGGTWWELSPAVIRRFLGVLGFEKTRVRYHRQLFQGETRLLFTVVGQRTRPAPILASPHAFAA